MKAFIITVLVGIFSAALCWEYPGYPGEDCPTAQKKMRNDADIRWMIPLCNPDGTFQDLQCYDKHPNICMCVAPDGSPLTLPGFGLNVTTCVCYMSQYNTYEHNPHAEMPRCKSDGSFEPLQCSKISGECWCVDSKGTVTVPPSKDIHDCDD